MKKVQNKNLKFGKGVIVEENCVFSSLKDKIKKISFGDYCSIKENCRFYVDDEFSMGDYGVIHNNTMVQCYKPCTIGHNAWIGQNSIINATDKLKIGNNFGIGTDSKIWTHAFHGELLLGCRIAIGIPDYKSKSGAIVIGDDFWGIGQITIGPGVKIGNKVIALTNSLITKDIPNNTIVAGIPARPIKINGDFQGYKDLSVNEKFKMMKKFAEDFTKIKKIKLKVDDNRKTIIIGNHEIKITSEEFEDIDETSYFNFIRRVYTKKHNFLEHEFMKFVIGYRARYIPIN